MAAKPQLPLADLVAHLREELATAAAAAAAAGPAPGEVVMPITDATVEVCFTAESVVEGGVGVKLMVFEASGGGSEGQASVHKLTLKLTPKRRAANGTLEELLVASSGRISS